MSDQPVKRIFIVDDHPVLRAGLAKYIDAQDGLEVCGEAEGAQEAIGSIERLKPDLAIVDLSLKQSHGLELVKFLHARDPDLLILVLSMHEERHYAQRCIKAGARGYIMKREATDRIVEAIRTVLNGKAYLSTIMTQQVINSFTQPGKAPDEVALQKLSDREIEVFEMIGRGQTTKDIASQLGLSNRTIESYRDHIKTKLNIPTANDLVIRAVLWVDHEQQA